MGGEVQITAMKLMHYIFYEWPQACKTESFIESYILAGLKKIER